MKKNNLNHDILTTLYTTGSYTIFTNSSQKRRVDICNKDQLLPISNNSLAYAHTFLRLYTYFDSLFLTLAKKYAAQEIIYPTLMPKQFLTDAEYFTSFPDFAIQVDEELFLPPALCYFIYNQHNKTTLKKSPVIVTTKGKCFRNEKFYSPPQRLREFTMREIVILGRYDEVETVRKALIGEMIVLAQKLEVCSLLQKTTDPFFTQVPTTRGKRLLQQLKPLKFELQATVDPNETLALSSFNNHEEFFGQHFSIVLADNSFASSGCIAFGIERWVYAFMKAHGAKKEDWPAFVQNDKL